MGGVRLTGVDVGASSVKVITGTVGRGTFKVDALACIPLAYRVVDDRGIQNPQAVVDALVEAFAQIGAKAPLVSTAMRGGAVLTKRVTIPKVKKEEIRDQARFEAEQVLPQDIATILVDYVLLGEGNNVPGAPAGTPGWDIMLVGARIEETKALMDAIQTAGGSCKCIDLDALVICDFVGDLVKPKASQPVAFVDVGASATRVTVRHKGKVVYIREFPVGGHAFTETIGGALGLSFEDAEALKIQDSSAGFPKEAFDALQGAINSWKIELQQCEDIFVAQDSNNAIAYWYLFGGGALTPGLLDALQDERFAGRLGLLPATSYLKAGSKNVDPNLLAGLALRLMTSAGLVTRKGA